MRAIRDLRAMFDVVYDTSIIGSGFIESDEYYQLERERYWRSLELFCELDIPTPCELLEVGGGQLALLCQKLFSDHCTVADVSDEYSAPVSKAGLNFTILNLVDPAPHHVGGRFDVVVLLEVIEHLPIPAHVVFDSLKLLLKPNGLIFLTTPNLFRLRNVVRMIAGKQFLDHFTMPEPGRGLGHQLEYSAEHLRWQFDRAGLQTVMLMYDNRGSTGHSFWARLGRKLVAPLELRPIWRDGLVAAARTTA
jgi:SAM-dependent methyltransferase